VGRRGDLTRRDCFDFLDIQWSESGFGPAIAGFAIALVDQRGVSPKRIELLAVLGPATDAESSHRNQGRARIPPLRSFMQGFQFAMSVAGAFVIAYLLQRAEPVVYCNTPCSCRFMRKTFEEMRGRLGFLMSSAEWCIDRGAQFAARTHYGGCAMDCLDVDSMRGGLDCFFTRKDSGIVHGVLLWWDRGDFADGGDKYADSNRVPDELRSRVMAVYATMFMGVRDWGVDRGGMAKHMRAPNSCGVWVAGAGGSVIFIFRVYEARRNANSDRQIK